ncbi:MAG: DUF2085 domain-containing protein [Thermoplasmata archaeon]
MKFKWILYWRGYEIPTISVIIFLIVLIWSLGMILAPLTLPSNSVKDLTGTVGPVDNADIIQDMNPYAKFYYGAGDVNCHTIKERSFFINGNQMPFCVRDVAIFFGMTLGLGIVLFIRFPLKWWWLVGGLIPIGLDGGFQLLTSYESNNLFRLLTGGLAGLVTTFALGFVIYDASKMAMMKRSLAPELQTEVEPNSDLFEEKRSIGDMSDKGESKAKLIEEEGPTEDQKEEEEPKVKSIEEKGPTEDQGERGEPKSGFDDGKGITEDMMSKGVRKKEEQ